MSIRNLRGALVLVGFVMCLGGAAQPAAAEESPVTTPCAAAQLDLAALVAGAPAAAEATALSTAAASSVEGSILTELTAKPARPGYCRCGCGARCTTDADCGAGGSCVAFISCC